MYCSSYPNVPITATFMGECSKLNVLGSKGRRITEGCLEYSYNATLMANSPFPSSTPTPSDHERDLTCNTDSACAAVLKEPFDEGAKIACEELENQYKDKLFDSNSPTYVKEHEKDVESLAYIFTAR
ncbi:hypothetical protein K469DRAFT_694856 [Zopfia rhizophila CBS 207.26]|uniref:Uncharacterized protein n=1 Tax=Zopfia rhizophila CBS 207.26 TaxID=1314779 RepID=A0A6A6EQ39_9PEZI|nr:hypothetical protein K469DRAFT_694856 [Zopfia rhizophila CBS 207.26]